MNALLCYVCDLVYPTEFAKNGKDLQNGKKL